MLEGDIARPKEHRLIKCYITEIKEDRVTLSLYGYTHEISKDELIRDYDIEKGKSITMVKKGG